jgi:peptidyl-tRNA hydrolase, PTH1 family
MFLIVGLGNPGRLYLHNRHNVGFHVLELLASRHHLDMAHRRAKAIIASGRIGEAEVVLAKPQTFMNRSGTSVAPLALSLHVSPGDLLVVYDDLDLPVGTLRLRPNGSAGGHHGMESIITALGNREFPRLRIGIGRPGDSRSPDEVAEYVLGDFSTSERTIMAGVYARAADAIECLLAEGPAAAMNRFNIKDQGLSIRS